MENSMSSCQLNPTKENNIFKKSSNVECNFDISNNSSPSEIQSNKFNIDHNFTSANKKAPFLKLKRFVQQFNVTFEESCLESETDKSLNSHKVLFTHKSQPPLDLFNVTFNETNVTASQNDLIQNGGTGNQDISNSIINKNNTFKKSKISNKDISKKHKMVSLKSFDKESTPIPKVKKNFSIDEPDIDTSFKTIKKKLFEKKKVSNFSNYGEISAAKDVDEEKSSNSVTDVVKTQLFKKVNTINPGLEFSCIEADKSESVACNDIFNYANPPKNISKVIKSSNVKDESSSNLLQIETNNSHFRSDLDSKSTISNKPHNEGIKNKHFFETLRTEGKDIVGDKGLSVLCNKSILSEITLEQSSYNDENLNQWMSDHSDQTSEEVFPVNVSPVLTEPKQTGSQNKMMVKFYESHSNNSQISWEDEFNKVLLKYKSHESDISEKESSSSKKYNKKKVTVNANKYRPPKLCKPAPFASKMLYNFIIKKLKPKYGIDSVVEAESLVLEICDTVKTVTRRKNYQKPLIQNLKKKMAAAGIIETTMDFYEFTIKYLPYDFRIKVIPCIQLGTGIVFPPKPSENPFDKIVS